MSNTFPGVTDIHPGFAAAILGHRQAEGTHPATPAPETPTPAQAVKKTGLTRIEAVARAVGYRYDEAAPAVQAQWLRMAGDYLAAADAVDPLRQSPLAAYQAGYDAAMARVAELHPQTVCHDL